jgi:ribosomal protein S18 acetylase RimI-like enzyme
MNIRLEAITRLNWEEALELQVTDDHKEYVASNLYSIAEAQFIPGVDAYAIYREDKMVGFAMFGSTDIPAADDGTKDPRFWIWRLMIAEGEQYKGYGKEAMKIIIGKAREADEKVIMVSTEPQNVKAIKFYKDLGFEETGIIDDGEEVFRLPLEKAND